MSATAVAQEYTSLPLAWDEKAGLGEASALLGGKQGNKDFPTSQLPAAALYRNFYAMSVAFALNHGCVTVCLAYASSMLGDEMGSVSSGCLYVSYAVSAFLLAKPLVAAVGPKNGLSLGVVGYCVYTACFLLAVMCLDITGATNNVGSWLFSVFGGVVGGVAGGLLWTAQGRYFARSATLFAQQSRQPLASVNATMSAVFAAAFLGVETAAKLLATAFFLLFPSGAPATIFSVYTLVAAGSVFVVFFLDDLDESGNLALTYQSVSEEAGKVARLVYLDRRLVLLLPFQIAFGFASSFVPYYVFGTVISDSPALGSQWVGLLSAVVVLTGSAMALPSAWAANEFGKDRVLVVGGVCLLNLGLSMALWSDERLGTWAVILPYLVVYGVGRGIWESINKAVLADFYADNVDACTTAFAAATFFNGYASAMGYFTYAALPRAAMAWLLAGSALLGLVCMAGSFRVEEARREFARAALRGEQHRDLLVRKAALSRSRHMVVLNGSTSLSGSSSDSQDGPASALGSVRGPGSGLGSSSSRKNSGSRGLLAGMAAGVVGGGQIYVSASGVGVTDGTFRTHESPTKAPI